MGREVSESCVDSLLTEIVSSYSTRFYANKPDLAARTIEAIGYQVGHQLSERYTMERPRFSDHLEAIKFICKDFWSELFKKQIDNLKTNHRGTFVLQDNQFRWLSRVSMDPSMENSGPIDPSTMAENKVAQATSMHLYFPCGIIRGALSNLGIPCAVSADISNLPAWFVNAYFQLKGVWNVEVVLQSMLHGLGSLAGAGKFPTLHSYFLDCFSIFYTILECPVAASTPASTWVFHPQLKSPYADSNAIASNS